MTNENYSVSFDITYSLPSLPSGKFTVHLSDNRLTVRLYYDFSENPLTLTADGAGNGDKAEIRLTKAACALYINGRLADEEWHCGHPEFTDEELRAAGAVIGKLTDGSLLPEVTRTFSGADGLRIPGVNIGDCMPFTDESSSSDGRFHLFWLYDRHHHCSKWGLGAHQWAHASTTDFINWTEHPMAVGITEPWEGSICTGSVMTAEKDGKKRFYAWYAVRMSDRSPARLTCAVSDDNIRFIKSGDFFTLPSAYEPTSARDPKVFGYNGKYHMIVTTTLLADGMGCLAHLTSSDLSVWEDEGVLWSAADSAQPECTDWFCQNGRFYLVLSLHGTGYYFFSDTPFSGWRAPEENSIPCGRVPKSALFNGRRIFCGFESNGNSYAGSLVACEAIPQPGGELEFMHLSI